VAIEVTHDPEESLLQEQGVRSWPIWECQPSEFPWRYDERETCYLLEGEAQVTPDSGEPISIKEGDMVTFPEGVSCTWKVRRAIRKHYRFG
jgi:uncharacterized cupin superfamily protein